MPPLIIAHRGASADATENTMRAFTLAEQQGAQMLELDVRATADGQIVVFHDATTERWNGRPDPVGSLTWQTLQHLSLGGERMPLLRELAVWARERGMALNVEVKEAGIEGAVVKLLAEADITEQVIVSSFYPTVLHTLHRIAPQLRRGVLMGVRSLRPRIRAREAMPLLALRRLEAYAWHPAYQLPWLPRIIRGVKRRGYRVNVWTVDDPVVIRQLWALEVDGIITNRPALLRDMFAAGLPPTPAPPTRRRS